ncbi:hypothetical protein [Bacillus cihuensis]|uniref:hypothetical protein n=1 Tax=Bacillus cihuensis TaxID=1208599 RepID=UPI000429E5DF|nr:hypothetical protein [Bacillus cihuensis]
MAPKKVIGLLLFIFLIFINSPAHADVYVEGYTRSDGTKVKPHYRSDPDGNFSNNWSTKGNVNPYTGEIGTKTSPDYYGGNGFGIDGSTQVPQINMPDINKLGELQQAREKELEDSIIKQEEEFNRMSEEAKKNIEEFKKSNEEAVKNIDKVEKSSEEAKKQVEDALRELEEIGNNYTPPTVKYESPLENEQTNTEIVVQTDTKEDNLNTLNIESDPFDSESEESSSSWWKKVIDFIKDVF